MRQVKLWTGQQSQLLEADTSALYQVCNWEAHGLNCTSGLDSRLCHQPARELGQVTGPVQSLSTPLVQHSRDLYIQYVVPVESDGKG